MARAMDTVRHISILQAAGHTAVRSCRTAFWYRTNRQLSVSQPRSSETTTGSLGHSARTIAPVAGRNATVPSIDRTPSSLATTWASDLPKNNAQHPASAAISQPPAGASSAVSDVGATTQRQADSTPGHVLLPDLAALEGKRGEGRLWRARLDFATPERTRKLARKERKERRSKSKVAQQGVQSATSVTEAAELLGKLDLEAKEVHTLLKEVRSKPKTKEHKRRAEPPAQNGSTRTSETKRVGPPKKDWQMHKAAVQEKLGGQAWNPRKRISPDAIAGVRSLHESDPTLYSTARLAEYFQISPDAVRRILKSKWQPKESEAVERRERWERRGERKWSELAAQGVRPPKKWRTRGIGKVDEGEMPPWKRSTGSGERHIEHRSPEQLFASAAQAAAKSNAHARPRSGQAAMNFSTRFL